MNHTGQSINHFFLCCLCFQCYNQEIIAKFNVMWLSLMFSPTSFLVLGLKFRSLTHFELIFVYCIRFCYFFFCYFLSVCPGDIINILIHNILVWIITILISIAVYKNFDYIQLHSFPSFVSILSFKLHLYRFCPPQHGFIILVFIQLSFKN